MTNTLAYYSNVGKNVIKVYNVGDWKVGMMLKRIFLTILILDRVISQTLIIKTYGRFVDQKLMLSTSFSHDQIHNCRKYDFGHTLLSYLSPTWTFNKIHHRQCSTSLMSLDQLLFIPFFYNSIYSENLNREY